MSEKNYAATEYPEIYGGTYWGSSRSRTEEIIENRNGFVEKYEIKKYLGPGRSM